MIEFWQNGFNEPFFSQRMSDGTLKLFAYYMLLHEKNPRQLVFIEEPENGLYHQYLADLAIEMSKNVGTGYNKQLFVTTVARQLPLYRSPARRFYQTGRVLRFVPDF